MMLFVLFLGLPLAIYFGLAFLPAGRAAGIGLAVVGLLIALLWLTYLLTIGPFFTGDANADAYSVAMVVFYSGAWGMALLAQTLGRALARRFGGVRHWMVVVVIFAVAGLPALRLLGV